MYKYILNENFDLEDERDVLLKAADYKCRLRRSDIEEALEPKDLIEDMEYIYNKLCGKYDDVNIKYWRYTEDGIKVFKSDGSIVKIEDDDFDKFYSKGITESWKKGDRVVLSTGETGTVYKDFDWQNEDQVAVQIDGMDKIKYPLSDTLTALKEALRTKDGYSEWENFYFDDGDYSYHLLYKRAFSDNLDLFKLVVVDYGIRLHHDKAYINDKGTHVIPTDALYDKPKHIKTLEFNTKTDPELVETILDEDFKTYKQLIKAKAGLGDISESNELEKRAKHHRKHQDGMSPFCSLGESLEIYNGVDIPDFDYSTIDLDNSREIGLHCGTEQACKDKGYKYINKLNVSNENILALDTDMAGYWSDPAMLKHLTGIFSNEEISSLRRKMRMFSGEETGTKYKNYSKIIRDALLDKGYNVISYPNSVEDAGSTSYIILDSSIISKLTNISEQIDNSNCSLTLDVVTFTDSVLDTFNSLEFEQARIQVSKKFPNLLVNRSGEHVVLKGTYADLLAFLHQYRFENWESRIELLKESKKKKKKPYSSINKNAGNVEYNNAMFNHMNNAAESPSTNPTGPMGESIDDIDDSFDWDVYDYGGDDDYYDDYEQSGIYGGDMTYCPICNTKLIHDCDGDSMCPKCNEYSWALADKRRELDKSDIDEDVDGNSDFNAYAPQFGSTASKFIDGVNTVKNLGKTQVQ